jgi:hypothetical protein
VLENAIISRDPAVAEDDWTSILQFRAAVAALKATYARSTATDTEKIRGMMKNINDSMPGGFIAYRTEFSRLHAMLIATGIANVVSEAEMREWVKGSITNTKVFDMLSTSIYLPKPDATHQEIFAQVDSYLSLNAMIGKDPYGVIAGTSGKASVNAVLLGDGSSSDNIRTKCWSKGHRWFECTSDRCAVCRNSIKPEDKSCSNWKKHTNPKYKFRGGVPPWEKSSGHVSTKRKNNYSHASTPTTTAATIPTTSQGDTGTTQSTEKRPSFWKAFKASKKLKTASN